MRETRRRGRLVPRWTWLFLAGPILWYVYFWVVYLAAEAGCVAEVGSLVTWTTVVLTGITMVAVVYYAWRAFHEADTLEVTHDRGDLRSLVRTGLLLGGLFAVSTLFVGIPALMLQPC